MVWAICYRSGFPKTIVDWDFLSFQYILAYIKHLDSLVIDSCRLRGYKRFKLNDAHFLYAICVAAIELDRQRERE